MLDRTRRLVSGAVDLAKEVVGPGKRVEEGRAALDAFADGLDAHLGDLRVALRGGGRHRGRDARAGGAGGAGRGPAGRDRGEVRRGPGVRCPHREGDAPEVRKTKRGGRETAYYSGSGWDAAGYSILPAFGVLAGADFLSDVFDGDGGDGDGGWDSGGDGGDGGGGD